MGSRAAMILSLPSRISCNTKLKNPSNCEAQSRSISSYYDQHDTDNGHTRCRMTSQSELVLKWCGFFRPFLSARWLYISPLTASINVESSLTIGWAPESTITSALTAMPVITYADNSQSFMTENSVVPDDIARPIWPTVSNSLRQLQGSCFKLGDRLVAFMTGKDSTHVSKTAEIEGGDA